ncbi:MAG: NDP-sugar synthase [Dehalococcoidia bacterium]
MKAIMLAAGEGTRCYPFTYLSPKIAQEVCGIPLLEYMLSWFAGAPEIEKLYIAVRNDSIAETVENYLDKREEHLSRIMDLFDRLGFQVINSNPDLRTEVIKVKGWGTGGDLRLAINQIDLDQESGEDILVCNADYVIARKLHNGKLSPQLDLSNIISYHQEAKEAFGVAMTDALMPVRREEATRFGVAQLDPPKADAVGGRSFSLVRGFTEKPELEEVPENPSINAGVYIIDADMLMANLDEFLPEKPGTNLEKTLLERLASEEQSRLAGYPLDLEAWFDVGTLEQLVEVSRFIARGGLGEGLQR